MDLHQPEQLEHAVSRNSVADALVPGNSALPTQPPGVAPEGFTLITWEALEMPLSIDAKVELLLDAFACLEVDGTTYDQGVCVREEDAARIVRFACELYEQATEEPTKELDAA